jgi:hypothetical protein
MKSSSSETLLKQSGPQTKCSFSVIRGAIEGNDADDALLVNQGPFSFDRPPNPLLYSPLKTELP